MINSIELVFIVDNKNNPLKPQPRHIAHKKGLFHRTTGIWVMNKNRQILCQKRSLKKDVKPGFWEAFFGGHVSPDETYTQNAVKELGEELGITVKESDLIPYDTLKSDKPTHKEFQHIFALITSQDIEDFQFEKEEIDELFWKDLFELESILLKEKHPKWVRKSWDEELLAWLSKLPLN